MSFIAKNPLIIPEVETPSSTPTAGTRGLFAGKDGLYEIDSNNNKKRIATIDDIGGTGGGSGGDADERIQELERIVKELVAKSLVKTVTIYLPASAWVEVNDNRYSQVVSIAGVTEYSKIDLQPTAEQLTIFHEKDLAFVTENDNAIVTVFCIGQKPEYDYSIQATITEVELDG